MNKLLTVALSAGVLLPGVSLAQGQIKGNEFNPAVSLILVGQYVDIDKSELELPGFQLGGEAGLPSKGFGLGHSELVFSANVDDKFYGRMTAALAEHDGETEFELEEAFIETLALPFNLKAKAGKFFSGLGYLNNIHDHAHDFSDRPLVYDAMVGGHLGDTGLQLSWVAPTEFYLQFGLEHGTGASYPSGGNSDNNHSYAFFTKTGGDWGVSSSWQVGLSHYQTSFDVREAGAHDHGHGGGATVDNELKNGELDIQAIDFVYKWAPNGNNKQRNFKFQFEYFIRNEEGAVEFVEGANSAEADYDGEQTGFYVQAVYQFMPAWRVGVRFDQLEADNKFTNFVNGGVDLDEFKEESGLGHDGAGKPKRESIMMDYSPSHFSRIRLQFNQLDNGHDKKENIVMLQYQMSLGSHGAHTF